MKEFFKLSFITIIMGLLYLLTEILYRGSSYWQMALIGGTAGTLTGFVNSSLASQFPLWLQGIIGMGLCTGIEFAGGCYFNLYRGCNIWNYSSLPFNFLGQICIFYSLAWFFLSLAGIFLYNYIRWKVFKEQKPRYKIF